MSFRLLRSGSFRKIYAALVVVTLVVGGLAGLLIDRSLATSSRQEVEDTLANATALLSGSAVDVFLGGADSEPRAAAARMQEQTGIRVTWILEQGEVVADSAENPALMDDHEDRPEVTQARREGLGVSERHSHTVRYPMLYVARRIDHDGVPIGYVRCALPTLDAADRSGPWGSVLIGVLVGLAASLVLGYSLTRYISTPLGEFVEAAAEMGSGNYATRLDTGRQDEFGTLAGSLNRLSSQISTRIATSSREEAQLKAMLASMVEGVLAVDDSDRVTFCNGAARRLLQIDSEPHGRTIWELAPVTELAQLLAEAREARAVRGREFEWHRSGREQVIDAHASAFMGGGQEGMVIVLDDISDLRRLERIRRDFVANVSHELKTPLTAIRGFVETLLDGAYEDVDTRERFLRRIEANADRLNNLVQDLLSLARIESQEKSVPQVPVDWSTVLDDVLPRHEENLAARQQELVLDGLGSCRVIGDPEAMAQVLENLIDNAVKYSDGPGTIRITLARNEEHGVLRVADEGVGIPPEDLGRIFERFYRVDKARSQEVGGTGLGLSIVKNLVLSMDGDVRVDSQLGEGTAFFVELPLADRG